MFETTNHSSSEAQFINYPPVTIIAHQLIRPMPNIQDEVPQSHHEPSPNFMKKPMLQLESATFTSLCAPFLVPPSTTTSPWGFCKHHQPTSYPQATKP